MERLEAAIAAEPSASEQPPPPQSAEPPAAPEPASTATEPPQPQSLPQEAAQEPSKSAEAATEPAKPEEPPAAPPTATPAEPSPAPPPKEDPAPVQEQRPPSPPTEDIQVDEEPPKPPAATQSQDIEVDPKSAEPIEVDNKPSEPKAKSPSPARSEREGTPPPPSRAEKATDAADEMDVDDAPSSGPRPSSALYITGLRRPLQATALASYLSSQAGTGSSDDDYGPPPIKGNPPFVSPSCPNLWLSGIKDHAYYRTWSVSAASAIKKAVDGKKWPEGDVNAGTLHVEFIPDGKVNEFAQKEEDGWRNGRQRFEVVQDDEGCRLQPFGKLRTGPPPPEPAGAARGLLGRLGERMGPGGRPPRGGVNTVPIRGRGGGPGGPMRWTRARPSLSWSTGPRA